jgi:hypothetical protein
MSQQLPTPIALFRIVTGYYVTRAIHVVAELLCGTVGAFCAVTFLRGAEDTISGTSQSDFPPAKYE